MTQQGDPASNVCHECIDDQFLANKVKEQGARRLCSYCGEMQETVTLETLADRIHEALQEHFELTPTEPEGLYELMREHQGQWDRRGDPVEYVIADMAGLNERIADDVTALLSDSHRYPAVKGREDDLYGSEAMYEERVPEDWYFRDIWAEFCNEIQSRARFFSPDAEDSLNEVFGDLTTLKALGGRAVIRKIGLDDKDRFIWRARQAQSTKELKDILRSPAHEIGPPPSRLAKGGRMNAPGIRVFYGALDESTCVAEARAPVGSYVVVAKFELLHSVRLLDLDALGTVYAGDSHFDPDYAVRKGHAAFLGRLVSEISRPVMPQDEAFEYLPTQAVAEYLANRVKPRLDGIIFRSSQTGGVGHNLVLFNHACGVEPYDLPRGTEVSVHINDASEDGEDDEGGMITVFETAPKDPPERVSSGNTEEGVLAFSSPWIDFYAEERDAPTPYREPTLRLISDSVSVLDIKRVTYDSDPRVVIRVRDNETIVTGSPP